jgi:hypothetical protein
MLVIPGIPPYIVKSIRNVTDTMMEVKYHWVASEKDYPRPTAFVGKLALIGPQGEVITKFNLVWEKHQVHPFDLDYASSENVVITLFLHGVHISRDKVR